MKLFKIVISYVFLLLVSSYLYWICIVNDVKSILFLSSTSILFFIGFLLGIEQLFKAIQEKYLELSILLFVITVTLLNFMALFALLLI